MTKQTALELINEAKQRIEKETGYGGAYWRLAVVLKDFLQPTLENVETKAHADFIKQTHGVSL